MANVSRLIDSGAKNHLTAIRAAAARHRADIAAYDAMLMILEQNAHRDEITLFDLPEGSDVYNFWIRKYASFRQGGQTDAEAAYVHVMTRREVLDNRTAAQRAHDVCIAALNRGNA